MADTEDFEVDPAIAEAMGFSGFGMQPGKKRKFDTNDGFVDPAASASSKQGKGANSTPLGMKAEGDPARVQSMPERLSESREGIAAQAHKGIAERTVMSSNGDRSNGRPEPSLEELRNGVRDDNGDMVYFLASFLEDPWKGLRGE